MTPARKAIPHRKSCGEGSVHSGPSMDDSGEAIAETPSHQGVESPSNRGVGTLSPRPSPRRARNIFHAIVRRPARAASFDRDSFWRSEAVLSRLTMQTTL